MSAHHWISALLVLLVGCAAEVPLGEPCSHSHFFEELELRARVLDVLIVVDGRTVPNERIADELEAHLRQRFEAETDEVYAGVVSADPCSPDFGELVSACGGPALVRSHRLVSTPDELVETMVCRAQSASTCAWDPATALQRVITRHGLPREGHQLDIVLVTAGDIDFAPELEPRGLALSIIAGYEADAPVGCASPAITATSPTRLHAWARRLFEERAEVVWSSVCGVGWDAALHQRRSCLCPSWTCLPRMPVVVDGLARCELLERWPADTPLSRCTDLPGRVLVDEEDPLLCRVLQRRDAPGFYLRDLPDLTSCGPLSPGQLEITVELMPGAHVTLECQTELGDIRCPDSE